MGGGRIPLRCEPAAPNATPPREPPQASTLLGCKDVAPGSVADPSFAWTLRVASHARPSLGNSSSWLRWRLPLRVLEVAWAPGPCVAWFIRTAQGAMLRFGSHGDFRYAFFLASPSGDCRYQCRAHRRRQCLLESPRVLCYRSGCLCRPAGAHRATLVASLSPLQCLRPSRCTCPSWRRK
jgi:hypothetical protein